MMEPDHSCEPGIHSLLKPFGLLLLGALQPAREHQLADIAENKPARQLLLIGNGGSSFWQAFSCSPEFRDGRADPLDRWSRRAGDFIANDLGGRVVFPFDGPPYAPFLSWAGKTGQVLPSPVSMYLHASYGLWHAYRFALVLPEVQEGLSSRVEFKSPCLNCKDQPCTKNCPVNAFTQQAYRVDQCLDYLVKDAESSCRRLGCKARRACPVGSEHTYLPQHAAFHMDAFRKSYGL